MKTFVSPLGVTISVLCLAAIAALAIRGSNRSRETRAAQGGETSSHAAVALTSATKEVAADTISPAAPLAVMISPLPANAVSVPDADLLKLSRFVDLPGAGNRGPDKERWAQAVPVATKLMQGPCDCEQRNWLKHFVRMGNDALADSSTEYSQEAQLMATLRRSDTQPAVSTGKKSS